MRLAGARRSTSKWSGEQGCSAVRLRDPAVRERHRWPAVAAHRHDDRRPRATHPVDEERAENREDGQAERPRLGRRVMTFVSRMEEHERKQQREHDQQDWTEDRVRAAAVECAPEPDHEGRMLQDWPARRHIRRTHGIS